MDGSERLQLTPPHLLASVPVWSPDGKQIAFTGAAGDHPVWQVYVVSADGGNPQQLTFDDDDHFSPWWSPDGSHLAYSGYPVRKTAISVMELSTRKVSIMPASEGFCCPTWSRSGKTLLALATSPGRIMSFDFATSTWTELWQGAVDYYDLSKDERYLYFDSTWQDDPAVFRLRIRDRKLERVVSLKGFRRTRGANGTWFDIAPDDSPLLLRNLSTEQIYELDVRLP